MSQAYAARGTPARRRGRPTARHRAASVPIEYSLLLTATLCLIAFGAVMVFSASSTTSLLGQTGDGAYYLKRTVIFGALGLVAMRVISIRGLRAARALTPVLLVLSFVLLLAVLVPGVGTEANGAHRWITAGPIQVQPSELAKVSLILYGAHLIAARPGIVRNVRTLAPYLAVVATAAALIVVEPDLGTALVLAFAVAALLLAGGVKLRHLMLVASALALIALVVILIEPYRRARLIGFLHPGSDVAGSGFQGIQAAIALGSGGIFGVGLGESVQKAFYLPEAHTDMIAAVIGEELGLVGITVLVGLFAIFGYAGFRTAQHARDRYSKLLAAGLTSLVLVQAVVNLFAAMGLAPLTGVPLPFVSYGNSNLLVMLAAVGLVLNVARGARAPRAVATSGGSRGAGAKLRLVEGGRSTSPRSSRSRGKSGDSDRRYRRARRAGARGRRRAAR
jgi:cell division protein FtsW